MAPNYNRLTFVFGDNVFSPPRGTYEIDQEQSFTLPAELGKIAFVDGYTRVSQYTIPVAVRVYDRELEFMGEVGDSTEDSTEITVGNENMWEYIVVGAEEYIVSAKVELSEVWPTSVQFLITNFNL